MVDWLDNYFIYLVGCLVYSMCLFLIHTYFCSFLIMCLKRIEKGFLDTPCTTATTLAVNWSVNQIFQKFHTRNVRLLLQNLANEQQAAFFQSNSIMPMRKNRAAGREGAFDTRWRFVAVCREKCKNSSAQKLHFQFIYSRHASEVLSTATLHQTLKIWRLGLMKSSSAQNVTHLVSIYKLEVELSSVWAVFFLHFSLLGVCGPSAQHPPKSSGILGERVFFLLVSCVNSWNVAHQCTHTLCVFILRRTNGEWCVIEVELFWMLIFSSLCVSIAFILHFNFYCYGNLPHSNIFLIDFF